MRYDIDMSLEAARLVVEIEQQLKCEESFFILIRAEMYDAFRLGRGDKSVVCKVLGMRSACINIRLGMAIQNLTLRQKGQGQILPI